MLAAAIVAGLMALMTQSPVSALPVMAVVRGCMRVLRVALARGKANVSCCHCGGAHGPDT